MMTSILSNPPRLVFWEMTRACNLRCIHCRASATELCSAGELDFADCARIIDELAEFAPLILVLSGGEPLYRKDVFELARLATRRKLRVALATNGTLITPLLAERIREAGIQRVAVSLDGPDSATHDIFRGVPGCFEKAIEGLRHVQRAGVSVQINTTVAKHNASKLPETLDLALRLGADAFHVFLLVPVGCGLQIAEDQMVEARGYEQILNWLYDRMQEGRIELKATCAPHFFRVMRQRRAALRRRGEIIPDLLPTAHRSRQDASPGMNAMTRGCLAGSAVCFISHEGAVFPCGYLPLEAGNLRRESFSQIWRHAPLFASLRGADSLRGKCGVCEFNHLCGGCRARAFGCAGDYLGEEPYCAYRPAAYC